MGPGRKRKVRMPLTSKPATMVANKRFTVGNTSDKTAEGTVAVGIDRNEKEFLVHSVGRQSESIALHAVATALGNGRVVPFADYVAVVKDPGTPAKLAKAVADATDAPKPKAPASTPTS